MLTSLSSVLILTPVNGLKKEVSGRAREVKRSRTSEEREGDRQAFAPGSVPRGHILLAPWTMLDKTTDLWTDYSFALRKHLFTVFGCEPSNVRKQNAAKQDSIGWLIWDKSPVGRCAKSVTSCLDGLRFLATFGNASYIESCFVFSPSSKQNKNIV